MRLRIFAEQKIKFVYTIPRRNPLRLASRFCRGFYAPKNFCEAKNQVRLCFTPTKSSSLGFEVLSWVLCT